MSTSTNASTPTVISVSASSSSSSSSSTDTFLSSTAPMTSTSSTSSILSSITSSDSSSSSSSVLASSSSSSTMASSTTDEPPVSSSSSVSSSVTPPPPPPSSSSSSVSSSTPPPPSSSSSSVSSSSTPPPPPPSSSSTISSSSEPPPPPPSSSSRPVSSTSAQTPPTSTPAADPPASSSSNSPPPSSSSSSSPHPENIFSTLSSRIVITTTDSRGVTSTTAPSVITETSTSTQQDGSLVTVTQTYSNPTLSPDNNNSKGNSFFSNTGAVAGVFVLVGLAAASIILWIFFAVRRRRRTQRIEHDTAVSATLAAAGFHRTPLDDDDDPAAGARHMRYGSNAEDPFQRRSSSGLAMSSVPSAGRASAAYLDRTPDENGEFNPYASGDYVVPAGTREGYISGTPLNATQASQSALIGGVRRDRSNSSGLAEMGAAGHAHNHSNSGSFEPLLASYYRRSIGNPPSPVLPLASVGAAGQTGGGDAPLPPDTNTVRFPPAYSSEHGHDQPQGDTANHQPLVQFDDAASSVYSNDSVVVDERLDPGLRQRLQHNTSTSSRDLRDEEDYSRPVLGVRNLPDGASQMSA